jgi:hypothetical protein
LNIRHFRRALPASEEGPAGVESSERVATNGDHELVGGPVIARGARRDEVRAIKCLPGSRNPPLSNPSSLPLGG